MSQPLLSVRDLAVGFGVDPAANTVVRGVDFDVRQGETLALLGSEGLPE